MATCLHCDEEFESEECPFGDSVMCPHCGTWMDTDWDEDFDNLYWWVTQISKEQK